MPKGEKALMPTGPLLPGPEVTPMPSLTSVDWPSLSTLSSAFMPPVAVRSWLRRWAFWDSSCWTCSALR